MNEIYFELNKFLSFIESKQQDDGLDNYDEILMYVAKYNDAKPLCD